MHPVKEIDCNCSVENSGVFLATLEQLLEAVEALEALPDSSNNVASKLGRCATWRVKYMRCSLFSGFGGLDGLVAENVVVACCCLS